MLAVVKTPRTNLRISGFIPMPVLRILQDEFGGKLTVTPDKAETGLESVFDSAEYKAFKSRVTPADYIRTYRENAGMAQADLAKKLNVSRSYICDVEHNRRTISKEFAKKVSQIFKIAPAHLI